MSIGRRSNSAYDIRSAAAVSGSPCKDRYKSAKIFIGSRGSQPPDDRCARRPFTLTVNAFRASGMRWTLACCSDPSSNERTATVEDETVILCASHLRHAMKLAFDEWRCRQRTRARGSFESARGWKKELGRTEEAKPNASLSMLESDHLKHFCIRTCRRCLCVVVRATRLLFPFPLNGGRRDSSALLLLLLLLLLLHPPQFLHFLFLPKFRHDLRSSH